MAVTPAPSVAPLRPPAGELDFLWQESDTLYCEIGASGRLMRLNPAWQRVLGHPVEALLGTDALALVHPGDRAAADRAAWGRPCAPRVTELELRHRAPDGGYRTLSWSGWGDGVSWRGVATDVTERRERSDFHQAALDSLETHLAVLDADGAIVETNLAWERFAIDNGGAGVGIGANYLDACAAAAAAGDAVAAEAETALREILAGRRETYLLTYPCDSPDEERWFVLRATRHHGPGPTKVVVNHQDITSHRRAERDALVRARLLDEVDAAVIATDLAGTVTHWNRRAEQLYGWTREETLGRPITMLTVAPEDEGLALAIMESIRETGAWEGEFEVARKDGGRFPAYVRDAVITDGSGRPSGIVGVSVDVSKRVRAEQELRSARDYLRAVAENMGEGLMVNDEAGRLTFFNSAAERMLGWSLEDLAGQSTHDVLHHHREDGSAFAVGDCPILRSRRDDVDVRVEDDAFVRRDGSMLPVSYTAVPFETPEGVRGSVVVFSDNTARRADQERVARDLEALSWLTRIREALEQDRFVLHAQPIVDVATGETVQNELLIRMLDEDGSLISPGQFLPIAEEYGLIRDIDRWVIAQAAALTAEGCAVEINLSAKSLADPDLVTVVERELALAGGDPRLVVFELTETALLHDQGSARTAMEGLEALGAKLALDDFGTGYGGLSYLKRLPVDYLKIDVDFVRDLPHDASCEHLVRAVVSLARAFGQKTVAEGVEDAETLARLVELGVDYAQGYFIGRPAPLPQVLGTAGSR